VVFCGPTPLCPDDFAGLGATVEHKRRKGPQGADAVNVLRLQIERMDQGFVPRSPITPSPTSSRPRASS